MRSIKDVERRFKGLGDNCCDLSMLSLPFDEEDDDLESDEMHIRLEEDTSDETLDEYISSVIKMS